MFVDELDFSVAELNRAMVLNFPLIDGVVGDDGFYRLKRTIRLLGNSERKQSNNKGQ